MAASAASCTHCGKEGVGFKRCSVCKEACYCGAACQNLNWKRHKKKCAPPLPLKEVTRRVEAAHNAANWEEVLKWEGRMVELMAPATDFTCNHIIHKFEKAHRMGKSATGSPHHSTSIIRLMSMRVEVLGRMERFRDQGEAICLWADLLILESKFQDAQGLYQRARDIGEAHGLFSLESHACLGLGNLATREGRDAEGLDLLRNAFAAGRITEHENSIVEELDSLPSLLDALFKADELEEVAPLLPRFREAAKADSQRRGRVCCEELRSHYYFARLHEARGKPQQAAREMCALLDRLLENQRVVHDATPREIRKLLQDASDCLKILDPELGEEDLVQLVKSLVDDLDHLS